MWHCFLLCAYLFVHGQSVNAAWPVVTTNGVQLLGLFSNEPNSSTMNAGSLQSRAMFISAVLLARKYNIIVDGQPIGWQSIGNGGNVINALSSACQSMATSKVVGIVGPEVSREARVLAPFAAKLNIPIISYAATDPELSDRQTYPTFYRTVPSDNTAAVAIAMFFLKWNWTSAIVVYQNDAFGSNGAKSISETFLKYNLEVAQTVVFDIVTHRARGDLKTLLMSSTTRIVILWLQEAFTPIILREAIAADVLGPQFTWIMSAAVSLKDIPENSREKLTGMFSIQPVVGNVVDAPYNQTLLDEVYQIWQQYEPETFPGSSSVDYYAMFAFDAAWTLIKALQSLCSKTTPCISFQDSPVCFDRQLLRSEQLLGQVSNTSFLSVSGEVAFADNAVDRTSGAFYVLKNIQNPFTDLPYVPVLIWSATSGWASHKLPSMIVWPGSSCTAPTGYANITGSKLRIVMVETAPFVITKFGQDDEGKETKKIEGFVPDLIEWLTTRLNFSVEMIVYRQENITYNGLIDDVAKGTYDLFISDVTINADRKMKVDFSSAIYDNHLRVITRDSPVDEIDWFFYLRPFSRDLRIVIAASIILGGILLFFAEGHRNPVVRRKRFYARLPMCWWYSTGTMAGYSVDFHVSTAAGRLVTLGLYIACFVFTAAYQANLTSSLTLTKSKTLISGIDDIKKGDIPHSRIGILKGTSIQSYYLREVSAGRHDFYPLQSKEEMFEKLLNNVIDASIMDSGVLEYYTNSIFCNLTLVGQPFDMSSFGIVFPKRWIYAEAFDVGLLQLRGSGKLEEIRARWFGKNDCAQSTPQLTETGLKSATGLFVVLGVIFVIAIPFMAAARWKNIKVWTENMVNRRKARRNRQDQPQPGQFPLRRLRLNQGSGSQISIIEPDNLARQ